MPAPPQAAVRNLLLAGLDPDDYAALLPHLEPVPLGFRQVLSEPHQPIAHVHFPEMGLVSLTNDTSGSPIEIGIIGREGTTGTPIVLGTDRTPFGCFMQIAGHGLRIETAAFKSLLRERPGLDLRLRRYALALSVQIAATAFVNAEYTVEMRLARWLLMCHDRVDGDDLATTHEFLAIMLGVRRPGVTTTIHVLEGHGLIRAGRGRITIRNRRALKEFADDAYGLPEAEYARLMAED